MVTLRVKERKIKVLVVGVSWQTIELISTPVVKQECPELAGNTNLIVIADEKPCLLQFILNRPEFSSC